MLGLCHLLKLTIESRVAENESYTEKAGAIWRLTVANLREETSIGIRDRSHHEEKESTKGDHRERGRGSRINENEQFDFKPSWKISCDNIFLYFNKLFCLRFHV